MRLQQAHKASAGKAGKGKNSEAGNKTNPDFQAQHADPNGQNADYGRIFPTKGGVFLMLRYWAGHLDSWLIVSWGMTK